MAREQWLNRGTALGLVLGFLLGVAAVALRNATRERDPQSGASEAPKDPRAREDQSLGKKEQAHRQCVTITKGITTYQINPANPGVTDAEKLPDKLTDLLHPFGGNTPLLEGGERDLIDPWGKRFQMERRQRDDGTEWVLIKTTAPDGTPITQFGIGPNAEPRF